MTVPPSRYWLIFLIVGLLASSPLAHGQDAPQAEPTVENVANEDDTKANDQGIEGEDGPTRAYVVTVNLPISDTVERRVKRQIDQLLKRLPTDANRHTLVLEFTSDSEEIGRTGEFESCLSLARHVAGERLGRVRTVAYLPNSVKGHAVLVVLACEQIIMSGDAELGQAGLGETSIDPIMRAGYAEISRRRFVPVPVALGMLDPGLSVYAVETADGVQYALEEDLKKLQDEGLVKSQTTLSPSGDMALFTGREMRLELGFATHLAGNRRELAESMGLPPDALEEDPSLTGGWRPVRLTLQGPVTARKTAQLRRSVEQAADGWANFILFEIDSRGGAITESLALARNLAELDSSTLRTVAYVPNEARADAAIIALACDDLVMGEEAILGGAAPDLKDQALDDLRVSIKALAERKSRDWSLMAAMIDRRLDVRRTKSSQTGEVRWLSVEEFSELEDVAEWDRGETVDTRGGFTSGRAVELGLAKDVVTDLDEVKQLYDLQGDIEVMRPNWALTLIEALANPWLAGTLLWLGFFMLITEGMSPGLGLPGFVAALCFTLYFWSQFLHGTSGWLEVLLFILGIACLILEIAVIPGFGVFGIGGVLLIVTSVILASQTFLVPTNSAEFYQFHRSLMTMIIAGAAAILAGAFMSRVLPEAPLFRRIMLAPPSGELAEELAARENFVNWSHLTDKLGVAVTRLSPAGKVRFGDELVDVISDGELLDPGQSVYVVEVTGNRVVVAAVEDKT